MDAQTSIAGHATGVAAPHITYSVVTSRDGTTIGYSQLGHGPGVVVLHGTMEAGRSHLELAEELADDFTVYLPDRRGRGRSGPYATTFSVQDEIDDLAALVNGTGTTNVFGVSSGAVIALHAALQVPVIRKVAAFEPPLLVGSVSAARAALRRLDREIAHGKVAAALITAMQAARLGPPFLNGLPRWFLSPFELLTKMAMANEDRRATGDSMSMRQLAPTLHYDFQLLIESDGAIELFKAIRPEVLLLGGIKSPAYLKAALDALESAVPSASRVELEGLDHRAAGNAADPMTGRGARPERVAQELRRFFAE